MPLKRFFAVHVLPALRPIRSAIALAVLLLFLATASYVAAVEAMREVLEVLRVGSAEEAGSPFLVWLRDAGVRGKTSLFLAINAMALLLPLATYILFFLRDIVFEVVSVRITQVLRDQLFDAVVRLPYLSLVALDPGTLVKRVAYDAAHVRVLIVQGGLRRVADLSVALGLLAYLFSLDAALAVVALVVVLAYFGGALWSAGLAKDSLRAMDRRLDALVRGAQDAFSRTTDIRANSREETERSQFAQLVAADAEENVRGSRVLMIDRSLTGFLSAIGPVIVTLVGGLFVLESTLTLETLVAFSAGTAMLYGPVNELSALPIIYQRSAVAIANVAAILDAPREGEGEPEGQELDASGGLSVHVRGLRYTYPGSERLVAIDTLHVEAGERVAIVGRSGSGKSTLLRILFRLLDDYEGEVRVEDRDVREWSRPSLRRHLAFMTQEAQLFPGTIRDNIAYGALDPHAATEKQLWSAAERARVDADIRAMTEKLDAELLGGAANLSGGQRRRLTLARALVKKPGLLLLDEPLTGVAPKDRREVVAALTEQNEECTILLVTHQHDLLSQMDRVVWMDVDDSLDDRGKLVTRVRAVGRHRDLLAEPAYRAAFGDEHDVVASPDGLPGATQ